MRKSIRNDRASSNKGSQLFQTIYCYDLFLCFLSCKFYDIIRSHSYNLSLNTSFELLNSGYAHLNRRKKSFLPLFPSQCVLLMHVLRNLYFIEPSQHFWMSPGIFSIWDFTKTISWSLFIIIVHSRGWIHSGIIFSCSDFLYCILTTLQWCGEWVDGGRAPRPSWKCPTAEPLGGCHTSTQRHTQTLVQMQVQAGQDERNCCTAASTQSQHYYFTVADICFKQTQLIHRQRQQCRNVQQERCWQGFTVSTFFPQNIRSIHSVKEDCWTKFLPDHKYKK